MVLIMSQPAYQLIRWKWKKMVNVPTFMLLGAVAAYVWSEERMMLDIIWKSKEQGNQRNSKTAMALQRRSEYLLLGGSMALEPWSGFSNGAVDTLVGFSVGLQRLELSWAVEVVLGRSWWSGHVWRGWRWLMVTECIWDFHLRYQDYLMFELRWIDVSDSILWRVWGKVLTIALACVVCGDTMLIFSFVWL